MSLETRTPRPCPRSSADFWPEPDEQGPGALRGRSVRWGRSCRSSYNQGCSPRQTSSKATIMANGDGGTEIPGFHEPKESVAVLFRSFLGRNETGPGPMQAAGVEHDLAVAQVGSLAFPAVPHRFTGPGKPTFPSLFPGPPVNGGAPGLDRFLPGSPAPKARGGGPSKADRTRPAWGCLGLEAAPSRRRASPRHAVSAV